MSLPVVFRRAARAEFDEAADWYEQRRSGLGEEFVSAIEEVLIQISATPERYSPIFQEVRRAMARRFPYSVFYRTETDRVVVLAIFHSSRDPSIWQERL